LLLDQVWSSAFQPVLSGEIKHSCLSKQFQMKF